MVRVRNCWNRGKPAIFIWLISALLFLIAFRLSLLSSSQHRHSIGSAQSISSSEQRSRLYDKMARDLNEHGAVFLQGGETSQSLSLSELFSLKDGVITSVLKAANPPVRANVLYLSTEFSLPISKAVRDVFLPYFDGAIWFQNSSLYHFSMFHASHHLVAVPATEDEIEDEANSVKDVAENVCPLNIILDKVILTSTGVLLGCWQVKSGTDPVTIRAKLRNALPHAPEKQLYNPAMLHTSFARLLGPPKISSQEQDKETNLLQLFQSLVKRLNDQLRGFEAVVSELWYVEEYDVLALALDGRIKSRKFQLGCKRTF
ncbi:hypothetical protein ACHQM5_006210 [Ranunculus cassubicifolius]